LITLGLLGFDLTVDILTISIFIPLFSIHPLTQP
jgi:hypothetical protein